jgi:hypothetical protein
VVEIAVAALHTEPVEWFNLKAPAVMRPAFVRWEILQRAFRGREGAPTFPSL